MKFEAKYFLLLLIFALLSYYGMRTMIITSNRVESNLGKDFDILNKELIETHFWPHSQYNIVFTFPALLTCRFILQLCKLITDSFHEAFSQTSEKNCAHSQNPVWSQHVLYQPSHGGRKIV